MNTIILPSQPTQFIGREDELADIARLLADPACRLLTLVGPGGIGKTRLAIEAAQRTPMFHGAYFVPLQPLTSANHILPAIAEALGLQFTPGSEPRQQLLDYLCQWSLLLVLDNLEHLLDGIDLLTEILDAAPDVRVLATSRERLNLREEWVLDVAGLKYPTAAHDTLTAEHDAVQLFVQHARRARANFTLTEAVKPTVIRICQLLGGMPLGIELAASRVRSLTCEAIAEEISQSLDILETPARNIQPRHRNMRAAFEPTWNRLTAEERAVFSALSVFRGGFTREAAEQVANATLAALTSLVDKSLLGMNTNGRYELHELLRQYAEEQLHLSADTVDALLDRHCHYYAEFLDQCFSHFGDNRIKQVFGLIETEMDNVRVMWDWALTRQMTHEVEMSIGSLSWFFVDRARFQEGERFFARAAAAFNDLSLESTALRAKILTRQGGVSDHLGLFAKANALLRESVAILRQTTDHGELALALRRLAIILSEQSPEEAAACLEESLTLSTMQNDRWSMGHALNWLSILHHREFERNGEPDALERAEKCAQQCLDIYQQLDSPWGIAAAYLNLADVARLRQDYAQCKQYALKGHILFREIGIFWGISISLTLIGDAACSNGAYLEARQYAAQGLQLSSEYRLPTVNFFSLHHLALVIDILLAENHTESAYEFIGLFYQLRQKVHANPSQRQSHPAFQCLSRLDGNLPSHLAAAVERGRLADADEMVQAIIAEFSQETTSKPLSLLNQQDTLSQRELEVLRLVAEGYSNHEIADRLYVGISTVKKHINHIYDKLDARNRTQAVAVARKRQLLTS